MLSTRDLTDSPEEQTETARMTTLDAHPSPWNLQHKVPLWYGDTGRDYQRKLHCHYTWLEEESV